MEEKSNWKVIYTASRQEKKVVALLDRYGIENYLPLIKKLRLWSDRKKWVEMPLFNGYVFVKPKQGERDRALDIPGVVKYLKYNGADAIVADREISLIRGLIERGYHIENEENLNLRKGDRVRIEQGVFKGFEAEVLKDSDGQESVIIAFETISQVVKISMNKSFTRLINKSSKNEPVKN
jgi:transcription antitermination factor NusG